MMFRTLLAATAFLPLAFSSSARSPLVAWSRHDVGQADPFSGLDEQDLTVLLNADELCGFDAVVVVDQPGLHAFDLKTLSASAAVSSRLKAAPKSLQRPYARRHTPHVLSDSASALASRCRSQMLRLDAGDALELDASRGKHVILITLPSMSGEGVWRKQVMAETDDSLSRAFLEVEGAFPKHLFIYTGSGDAGLDRRQSEAADLPFSFAAANGTSTGILHNYQLLTPGLIVSLFVAFFVLFPIILIGVNALSSIQSSVRLENPKAVGQDKKLQ